MSVNISSSCIGCGKCAEVCPGSLIEVKRGKAAIRRPERCWGCVSCVKECPAEAISFYLGADMGGLGGSLTVSREKTLLHWHITKPDGEIRVISVDSRDSNQY